MWISRVFAVVLTAGWLLGCGGGGGEGHQTPESRTEKSWCFTCDLMDNVVESSIESSFDEMLLTVEEAQGLWAGDLTTMYDDCMPGSFGDDAHFQLLISVEGDEVFVLDHTGRSYFGYPKFPGLFEAHWTDPASTAIDSWSATIEFQTNLEGQANVVDITETVVTDGVTCVQSYTGWMRQVPMPAAAEDLN